MGCGASNQNAKTAEEGPAPSPAADPTALRAVFDWSTCQFDMSMPAEAQGRIPDEEWYSVLHKVNIELLDSFAQKWKDPGLKEQLANSALKSFGTNARVIGALAIPIPGGVPVEAIEAAATAVEKVLNTAYQKARRRSWDTHAVPAFEEYIVAANESAKAAGSSWRLALSDVTYSAYEQAVLKVRRSRVEANAASAQVQEKIDSSRLRELAESFNRKVDQAAVTAEGKLQQADQKVGQKLEAGGKAAEKVQEATSTVLPCLFILGVPMTPAADDMTAGAEAMVEQGAE